MRPLVAGFLLLLSVVLPGTARAADVKTQELPSGKTYLSYRPKGLPQKHLLVLYLAHKGGAEAAAQEWKEKFSSIPVMAIFPSQEAKGWRVYDWETQKIVKDRELAYLLECVTHASKEYDIEKKHAIVAGDASGGDYAFELALRFPDRFAGSIAIAPTWCASNRFEANAKQTHIYFLVGAKDDRKKQAQDAHDRLRKSANDLIWRPVEELPKGMPPLPELARAVRWQQELVLPADEASLEFATKEWEAGCTPVGVHLMAKLTKDRKVAERAKKIYSGIEKQAQKELDEAQKQPRFAQMEELWRLHDRYGPLREIYFGIKKALVEVGADMSVAEAPPAAQPPPAAAGSDDATAKILETADRAQKEKKDGDYAKAIESFQKMIVQIDRSDLGAGEQKQLYLVAHYELARCQALSGRKQLAIDELTKAVDLGYDNWKQIDSDKELDSLRSEGAFQSLSARRNK